MYKPLQKIKSRKELISRNNYTKIKANNSNSKINIRTLIF